MAGPTIKKMYILAVFSVVSFVLWESTVRAEGLPLGGKDFIPRHALEEALEQNLKSESAALRKLKYAYEVAARPHSAYLLYQKNLGLIQHRAELDRLRMERREIVRRLDALPEGRTPSMFLFVGREGFNSAEAFHSYSGAPMLSFDAGSHFEYEPMQAFYIGWAPLFRVFTAVFLALIFSLPFIVLYKVRAEGKRPQGTIRIFPAFRVKKRNGTLELLKATFGEGIHLSPKPMYWDMNLPAK
ncbi:MAG: hypothetical protein ACE5GK_05315 [Nitrospiria bacterium]